MDFVFGLHFRWINNYRSIDDIESNALVSSQVEVYEYVEIISSVIFSQIEFSVFNVSFRLFYEICRILFHTVCFE